MDVHAKERAYVLETLERINNSVTNFLQLHDTPSHLTPAEETYYTIISLLTALLPACLQLTRSDPVPSTVGLLVGSLTASIRSLQECLFPVAAAAPEVKGEDSSQSSGVETLFAFASLHTMGMLRDSALVLKHSVAFLNAANDRERERDKVSGGLPKAVTQDLKSLDTLAATALQAVKDRIKSLKTALDEAGWMDRIAEMTLGSDGDGGEYEDEISRRIMALPDSHSVVEEWSGRLLEGWRDTAKGWAIVKME